MTRMTVSRRKLFATGACVLAGAVALPGSERASALTEAKLSERGIVRKWYAAWENKDLGTFNDLLADNFTFSQRGRRRPHQQKHFQDAMLGHTG